MTKVQIISENTNSKIQASKEKRLKLITISNQAKKIKAMQLMRAAGSPELMAYYDNKPLNFYIVNYIYKADNKDLEFKTFNEWKKAGATVRKGEKAFAIWGQPKQGISRTKEADKLATKDKESMYEFFPICYLFSSEQVYFTQNKENKPNEDLEIIIIKDDIKIDELF